MRRSSGNAASSEVAVHSPVVRMQTQGRARRTVAAGAVSVALLLFAAVAARAVVPDDNTLPTSTAALAPVATTAAPTGGESEIKAKLDGNGGGPLTIGGEAVHAGLLRRFYAAHGYEPVWTTRPSQATALWHAVMQAANHGLDPDNFHASAFARPLSPTDRDLLLSDAVLAYADALARGAVPDDAKMDDEDLTPGPVDTIAVVDAAIASPNPEAAINALAPSTRQYAGLQRAFQTYQAIAKSGGWPHVPPAPSPERARLLQQRLAIEGFLPAAYATNQLDDATIRAIKAFQERYGLEPADGKLGTATLTELNVPADARVQQIAVGLERLRWLPRILPPDRVWVNAANARLQLFRSNQQLFATRVVVGEVDKQTPEFHTQIVSLLYNPPWNIPYGIAQKEIIPKLETDPDYLEKHHMTMRSNGGIQQEAGPYSALGRLKFEMPNRFDVYLHDTPLRQYFARENRRLSHGCVRVQNPRELASLLAGIPGEDITRAINAGGTNRRNLSQPLDVFIVYQTTFVDNDGAIQFRRDFYQRDAGIAQRLNRGPQVPVAARGLGNQRGG